MTQCERTRELIPWYVDGSLEPEEARDVACHVTTCDECLREVASALRVRAEIRQALNAVPRVSAGVWKHVSDRTQGRPIARIDVGSFLLGFRLGASFVRGGIPVRGDLRLLGRSIRLFEGRRGGQG